MSSKGLQAIPIFVACLLLASCEEAQILLKKAQQIESDIADFTETPGEKAFSYLSGTYRDRAINVNAILEAMNVAHVETGNANLRLQGLGLAEDDEAPEVSDDTLDVMTGAQGPKKGFVGDDYLEIDNSFFTPDVVEGNSLTTAEAIDHTNDKVVWDHPKDDFTVSMLGNMPVRNQGGRGTCAAHAGVAQLEAYLLSKYGLKGIDLSEQRFYYMSKPDRWDDGGDADDEGSNSGTGFAKSNGYAYEGKTYPPGSPSDFNIPLETDCPYNPEKGKNDTQYPQSKTCESGVAKVTDFRAWLYKYQERISTAQQVFDMLVDKDLPVIVATKLSDNWENNDGIITLAASGGAGATGHAAGHAYIIVGAKKLDEAKYPDEGGMCFYVRNSWGRGWGVDGLSCMTLAWFNTWRYSSDFDQLVDANLDTTKFKDAKAALDTKPSGAKDADGGTGRVEKPVAGARRGSVSFLTGHALEGERSLGALVDDDNKMWKVLYTLSESKISIYGILNGEESLTQALELKVDGKFLQDEFAGKGTVTVGEIDTDSGILTLCALRYAQVCKLNYVEEFKELVVGLTKDEFQKQESQGPYNWKSLGISGYSIDFSLPGKGTSVDLRMVNHGTETNPLRFVLDPLTGDVNFQGSTIGSITKAALCSGDYSSVCRVVTAGEKFAVLFRANKK